jgi:hypothetical protein
LAAIFAEGTSGDFTAAKPSPPFADWFDGCSSGAKRAEEHIIMSTDITTIEKNRTEELRVALKDYKGHDYVDVRTYVEPYADEGQGRIPTKRGVTLKPEDLAKLIAALQEAEKQVRAAGLLTSKQETA